MLKRFLVCIVLAMLSVLLIGCSSTDERTGEVELVISAAASLTDALTDLQRDFEEANEGVKLTFNFGSSGKLAKSIENGAPADVFLSASSKDMNDLEEKGWISNRSRKDFTSNVLVLIAHQDSNLEISSFEDIDLAVIDHFAVGEPESVPVGRYTKETFEHLNVWESLQEKVVFGSDVRQVLTYVEMGNADLGVVYSSDAFVSDDVKVLATSDAAWHEPIIYPGAVVKDSKHPQVAEQFLDYLTSDTGKRALQKFGFK